MSHYLEHLAPVWRALRESERGFVVIPKRLESLADALDVASGAAISEPRDLALCASWRDGHGARVGRRRVVLMEHGVGQTYVGDHPAYAGGRGRSDMAFLCGNERVASANRATYPDAQTWVVGDPYLDALRARVVRRPSRPVVSFHFNASDVSPEAACTRSFWWPAVAELAARRGVIGHGHPRDAEAAARAFDGVGAVYLRDFSAAVDRATAYVCDNSSTAYYAAGLDVPVVLLNHPGYRRDVEHGLRFWEYADVGWQVDRPEDLVQAVLEVEQNPELHAERRAEVSAELFRPDDGKAAERAAEALREVR